MNPKSQWPMLRPMLRPVLVGVFSCLMVGIAHAQVSGLKVKVTKEDVRGKAADKTEQIYLKVELENTGSADFKDLDVTWNIVIDKEPERQGSTPKKTCISGKKIISLRPKDATTFQGDKAWVTKSGVGFYGNPSKREGWNPRYHGHALRIYAGGKLIYADYHPKTVDKFIEQYDAEQAANPKK